VTASKWRALELPLEPVSLLYKQRTLEFSKELCTACCLLCSQNFLQKLRNKRLLYFGQALLLVTTEQLEQPEPQRKSCSKVLLGHFAILRAYPVPAKNPSTATAEVWHSNRNSVVS
jgi:hypothetical protein